MNLRWKPNLESLDERITPSGYRDAPVSGGLSGGIPVFVAADNCPVTISAEDGYAYTTDERGGIIDCMILSEPTWPDIDTDPDPEPSPPTPPPAPDPGDGGGGGGFFGKLFGKKN